MPVDVENGVKKAEDFHSTVSRTLNDYLAIAHGTLERIRRLARTEIQGGIKDVAHFFLTSVYLDKMGISVSKVFIHQRFAEILLHSIHHDDVNGISVETAFP